MRSVSVRVIDVVHLLFLPLRSGLRIAVVRSTGAELAFWVSEIYRYTYYSLRTFYLFLHWL